jgi:acetyl esterase/lipase
VRTVTVTVDRIRALSECAPPSHRSIRVPNMATANGLVRLSRVAAQISASVSGAATPPIEEVPPDVQMDPDVAYLTGSQSRRAERADLYRPTSGGGNGGAVVVVHGGGWYAGDKRAVREVNICSNLALCGYVCLSVNYVLAPGPPTGKGTLFTRFPLPQREPVWPQNLHDCQRAVQYLRQHSQRLKIDPDRIGAIGGSAGGTLVHLLALGSGPDANAGLQLPRNRDSALRVGLDPDVATHVCCAVNLCE